MKTFVTGGTGFTGAALTARLLDDGHAVNVLDYKPGLRADELRARGANITIGSVTDKDVVERAAGDAEVYFHVAAAFRELNVPKSHYREVNVDGTKNVLEIAHKNNVKKFIYCSTCGVHGNIDNPPADESSPIQPADYYQQTKYDAEPLVMSYFQKGMKTVILRPAGIFGPGDPERFFMIFKRVATGTFPMLGSGKTLYHSLYIDNLIQAFLQAMKPGVGDGEAYLIADAHHVEIKELVERVANAMGVSVRIPHYPLWPVVVAGHVFEFVCTPLRITPPIFPRRVDWFRQDRAFDVSKAINELGYRPDVDLDEGLRRTYGWYVEQGLL